MTLYTLENAAAQGDGDLCRMEQGRLVLDGRQTERAELILPVHAFNHGDFIELNATAENSLEAFKLCYAGIRFYYHDELITNLDRKKAVITEKEDFVGHYQFHGQGPRDYQFRFIIPQGVERMELTFTVLHGAVLSFDALAICLTSSQNMRRTREDGIKLVSHLGMMGYTPKNTMHSFELARRALYHECVTNTNFTRDGHLVALHNNTIDATSNGTGAIRDMTLEEARQFDFGGYLSPLYTNTPLPLLDDVLSLMAEGHMHPVLRLGDFVGENAKYLAKLHDLVTRLNFAGHITAKAFSQEALEVYSQIAGEGTRYGLCTNEVTPEKARWLRGLGKDVYFDLQYTAITDDMLGIAADHGIPVEAWIVNEYDQIITLHNKGVSGFTTDFFPMDGCLFDS